MAETVTLLYHIEKILDEKDKANNQRFRAQEEAVKTAENSRDVAIKKAEDSIEKKSDAVYVKLTDLQKALTEVMLRPEIESRLSGISEKVDDLKARSDKDEGKDGGKTSQRAWTISFISIGISIIMLLIALFAFFNKFALKS